MLIALRAAARGIVVREHLRELTYLASARQLRETLGSARMREVCRLGIGAGWTTRTTAAILAAIWIGRLARDLAPERRMRLGQDIVGQERSGLVPLEWIQHFHSGRMNLVGIDVFLLRFNVANGTLVAWAAEGRNVDPAARRAFLAMAAWGLAGLSEAEVGERFGALLTDLGA